MTTNMTDKTCKSTEYMTPPEILEPVRDYFYAMTGDRQIGLDPATRSDNPTAARIWCSTKGIHTYTSSPIYSTTGLEVDWAEPVEDFRSRSIFLNPPYGPELRRWTRKLRETAFSLYSPPIAALLPGQRFETSWWQEEVLNDKLTGIVFIRKRVQFKLPDGSKPGGNPYGSMLYCYNGNFETMCACFSRLGMVLEFGRHVRHLQPPGKTHPGGLRL